MRCVARLLGLLVLVSLPAGAETYVVRPDGTGDFPNIHAAIDAVTNGDIIELTDGVFRGEGNRDIDFLGKDIVLRSQNGNPDVCIVDCEGSASEPHRGVYFHAGEQPKAAIEAVTIANGYADWGGGICIIEGSAPSLRGCIFAGNSAADYGGGLFCMGEDVDPGDGLCTGSSSTRSAHQGNTDRP